MVFSSGIFLYVFLPIVLGVYFLLPKSSDLTENASKIQPRNIWLLIASYAFYAWGSIHYVPLLLGSTTVDFLCAKKISNSTSPQKRKTYLWISILLNLTALFWFKYLGLFASTYQALTQSLELSTLEWASSVALPIGISFYTFQSMSYTIDVYRREVPACKNFFTFATYVSLFPQLVAGPIVRYKELHKQLRTRSENSSTIASGTGIFIIGLSKKILLANPLGWVADQTFTASTIDTLTAWIGILCYGFQLYFDFSGYSEMAIGLGLILGFHFPRNFNSPYLSTSITEFWRRWHITLGTWIRDYIYIPLGGNRGSIIKTTLCLLLVMLIAGLWHGAMWSFVLWGGAHGLLIITERLTKRNQITTKRNKLKTFTATLITFTIVQLLWVLFRSESIPLALDYYKQLFSISTNAHPQSSTALLILNQETYTLLFAALCITIFGKNAHDFMLHRTRTKSTIITILLLLSLAVLSEQSHNPFIYFKF